MLKARSQTEGGVPVMLLGLSGESVTRLAAGEPIAFNAADMGLPPCHVLIVYGRTEQAILDELTEHGARVRMHPPTGGAGG